MCLIPGHRKIGAQMWHPPGCGLLSGCQIDGRDLIGIRHVDQRAASLPIDPESLGMGGQCRSGDDQAAGWVQGCDPAAAVADEEPAGVHVDPDIVGIVA